MKLFILISALISSAISIFSYNQIQQQENLYNLIGMNIKDAYVQKYFKSLGEYKIEDYSPPEKDYCFIKSGIQFRVYNTGVIDVIFCYNKNKKHIDKPVVYKGTLPFGINFNNSLQEIEQKIGEGTLVEKHGFYGRAYRWVIQDSLKMAMEITLPKEDTGKIFIHWVSLSKNNN
jgi:hypothetical protein